MPPTEPALQALAWALEQLDLPSGPALWIGARPGLHAPPGRRLLGLQDFRPWRDGAACAGIDCLALDPGDGRTAVKPPPGQRLILLSPARQREAVRAEMARALAALTADGVLLVAAANDAGARSVEADLRQLCPVLQVHSKHKCRVLLARAGDRDEAALAAWHDLDAARALATGGLLSAPLLGAPGLFAVDRIDSGSALLIEHLPGDLSGALADLGSGLGVLAAAALERCRGLRSIDLFEASARALALSCHNLREATPPLRGHWCDVGAGLELSDDPFDVVLSNPPFHEGARGLPEIGQAFIRSAARLLRPNGQAWIVANAHLPYESVLAECFTRTDCVAAARGFKLLRAESPR